MRLIETDRESPLDEGVGNVDTATPPRPEHRRVYVSLALTASVLIGTVVAIYAIFPERHNFLMTRSLEAHRDMPELRHVRPGQDQLVAWGRDFFDGPAPPWPEVGAGVEILGVTSISVFKRRTALVRYRVGEDEISLVVQRDSDVLPRRVHMRRDGDLHVVSWPRGPWTFVAVGPADRVDAWRAFVGAP